MAKNHVVSCNGGCVKYCLLNFLQSYYILVKTFRAAQNFNR